MTKIKVGTVDMYAFCGRDKHPQPTDEGKTGARCYKCGSVGISHEGSFHATHCGVESFTFRVVCQGCQKDLGTKPCIEKMAGLISHGICSECDAALRVRMGLQPRS